VGGSSVKMRVEGLGSQTNYIKLKCQRQKREQNKKLVNSLFPVLQSS